MSTVITPIKPNSKVIYRGPHVPPFTTLSFPTANSNKTAGLLVSNCNMTMKKPRRDTSWAVSYPKNATKSPFQWLGCWFPLKGGIGSIVHPPIDRKNTTYSPCLRLGVIYYRSHLLGEPEPTIDLLRHFEREEFLGGWAPSGCKW